MNKNNILKSSFIAVIVFFILSGCYAADTMHPLFIVLSLCSGLYLIAFSIINQDKWIFKPEEDDDYEN